MKLFKDDFARKPDLQPIEARTTEEIFEEQTTKEARTTQANIAPRSVKSVHLGVEYIKYTPDWNGATTSPNIGNGILLGKYLRMNRHCKVNITLIPGSTTTFGSGNYSFSVPFRSANDGIYSIGSVHGLNSGTQRYSAIALLVPNSTAATIHGGGEGAGSVNDWGESVPFTLGAGDWIHIAIDYEVAEGLSENAVVSST